jgi:hypothetical protein
MFAPDLSVIANLLNTSQITVRTVLNSWGPGTFDAELLMDGKAFNPQQARMARCSVDSGLAPDVRPRSNTARRIAMTTRSVVPVTGIVTSFLCRKLQESEHDFWN